MKKIALLLALLTAPVFSKVVMISDMDLPPYAFVADTGMEGFEHDLLQEIATINNWDFQEMKMPFRYFFPFLQEGRAQIIVSGMIKTSQREKDYLLSAPYAYEKDMVMYLNHQHEINQDNDLFSLKIAGLEGSIQIEELFALGFPKENFVAADSFYMAFREVLLGNADAVLGYGSVLRDLADGRSGEYLFYEINGTPTREIVAIFDKNDGILLGEFNQALSSLKENGRYKDLHQKWFKTPL